MNRCHPRDRSPRRPGARTPALVAGCLALAVAGPTFAAEDEPKLESKLQRLSYLIGLQVAHSLRSQGFEGIDTAALALALDDVFEQRPPRLTDEEIQAVQAELQAERAAEQSRRAAENLAAGQAFLASNAKEEGVVEAPEGFQYRIVRPGEGPKPGPDDQVVVHYRGRLLDGTDFDSSYRRGEPAEFGVAGVIPGWQLALQAMPAGSRWEVWIPPELAYGERGAGGTIGPNETLHFVIDLIEVKPSG